MAVTTPMPALLELRDVAHTFADGAGRPVHALDGLSLELRAGEIVTVVGPSGCGKSTLLRLAAGLLLPTRGEVRFHGARVTGPDRRRGFVFQTYNAFPWLRVRDNVAFGLRELPQAERSARVTAWLEWTGLRDFAGAWPKALSGGMQQRLALARAMACEPELLLLDEPFGALDEHTRREMQALLLRTVERVGTAALMVTHDLREAALLADRVLLSSARPGRVLEVFRSPLPRPRHPAQAREPALTSLYEEIAARFPAA